MIKSSFLHLLVACVPLCLVTLARCDNSSTLIYSRASDMKDGPHTSPDGKFVVVSKTGEGEAVHIAIRDISKSGKVIYNSTFVDGFVWLPGRQHTLVFAVSSDNNGEKPGVFLWQNGKHARLIKGLKKPSKENVGLLGISSDGHKVAYEYWPNTSGVGPRSNENSYVKSLKLP